MVAPAPSDLQVARRVPLEPEAEPLDERDRSIVARLHVRLHPVEPDRPERLSEHEVQPFGHVPLAIERDEHRVPEVGAPEVSEDDLAQVGKPGDRVVLRSNDEKACMARRPGSPEQLGEAFRRLGQVGPRAMERTTRADALEELRFVGGARTTDPYPK